KLALLKRAGTLPAPSGAGQAAELAAIMARMEATYGQGKYCPRPRGSLRRLLTRAAKTEEQKKALDCKPGKGGVSLGTLSALMADSGEEGGPDEPALREAWMGWRSIAPPLRKDYARYVALGNAGAQEIGFADVGAMWRSGYDMPAEQLRREVDRLWGQVKPLYDDLHCYVRARLRERYGSEIVPEQAPIPAHLLGNMWAQQWSHLYPLVQPYPKQPKLDVTQALERQQYDPLRMVRTAERFFTSLGLDPLPATFWERSLFEKPADREVECHASAWDVSYDDDLRIKMCIDINEEDLYVVHHELGHNYYYHYYKDLPILFQQGANDGFHEAIGDAVALSMTPGYLQRIGLLRRVVDNEEGTINFLMKMALDKIAFLPFGKLIDQWRWDVFAGRTTPAHYNRGWWELRRRYQGIAPPGPRGEHLFDPGAKYHVPASVPYLRYFLAFIYQFQFQRALCREAGHRGPLHTCSIYGNRQAGAKLQALLELGTSKPWPDALEALSGERRGDASALLDYFAPLRRWLRERTKDEVCGW
ncbi:MAG: M2 family metallopeptidase, partial [Deltaproteobacteria bacterium]|nr:M2 family metallopeptidase [Deltaproteobacteria bacterium]MBW2537294.1 M2 family metallopeptidase [Deltaproteobacteria bacterium]